MPTCFLLDDARMMWDRGGAMFPEYWITMAITPNSIQLGANTLYKVQEWKGNRRRSGEAGSEKMPQGNTLFCGISSDAHL